MSATQPNAFAGFFSSDAPSAAVAVPDMAGAPGCCTTGPA